MPFNSLLLAGLQGNETLIENAVAVSINKEEKSHEKKEDGEIILLFEADRNKLFRRCLSETLPKTTVNPQCCDGIILRHTAEKNTICFVELKGKNIQHAAEQILNTWTAVSNLLEMKNISTSKIIWKAAIISSDSKPQNEPTSLKDLRGKFNHKSRDQNVLLITQKAGVKDLTSFIRA